MSYSNLTPYPASLNRSSFFVQIFLVVSVQVAMVRDRSLRSLGSPLRGSAATFTSTTKKIWTKNEERFNEAG